MTVFDFWIDGFRPDWCRSVEDTTARHGSAFAELLGRRLTRTWVAWHAETDRWFQSMPVLLEFGDDRLEITWSHWEAVSVTWNSVDPTARPTYEGMMWTSDRHEQLNDLCGQHLWAVDLLESSTQGPLAAIGLAFSQTYLAVADGGDWNRLEFGPPKSHYRQWRIASMPPTGSMTGRS